ncbi:MAG: hypothetical protein ABR499_02595 [Gemmatimonadaceae bacterium]
MSFVPYHNIGTPENPVYEGTPLHILAAIAAVPLCAALYTAAGYLLLTLVRRRAPAAPTAADRLSSTLVSQEPLGFPQRLRIAPFRRIAAVTLALSAIGVVVGAALGALAIWGLLVIESPRWPLNPAPLLSGAIFGGMFGFVLAPVAAWTLMPHVPLWRAIAETALGTAVGAAVGWVLGPRLGETVLWPFALGLVGFAAAAMRLRLTYPGADYSQP